MFIAPVSSEVKKIIDAIRDQTNGVPNNLVFVIDIVSVRFGGYFTQQIKAEIEKYPMLQMLTLNDCGIKSLQKFPVLPGLLRLDLVFNEITGESLHNLKGSRHLQTLMLGANKIDKFEDLEQLDNMHQLVQLDLINNPVSKLPGYRQKIFTIFPTITILDTLDKGGKDAYINSSMTLNASRVPDTLFQKNNPPLFVAATLPASSAINAKTKTTTQHKQKLPIASAIKRKSQIKLSNNQKKIGKTGKLAKVSVIGKCSSVSSRAGLLFPVGRLRRKLKESLSGVRVAKKSAIYLAAVIQYLSAQLVEGAGNIAKKRKKKKISPCQIKQCLKMDEQLNHLLKGVTILVN